MNMTDVLGLTATIHQLYADKFPMLLAPMLAAWTKDLAGVEAEVADQALRRWIRQHQPTYAPTLQGLLDTIELLLADEEDQRERRLRAQQRSASVVTYAEVLAHVAQDAPTVTQAWARCHVEMIQRGLGINRLEETAKACEDYATQWPDDAAYWHQEAAWWRGGAVGHLYFTSYRAPMMPGVADNDREPGDEEPF